MMAMKRMSMLAAQLSPGARAFGDNIQQYKEESEKEHMDEVRSLSPSLSPSHTHFIRADANAVVTRRTWTSCTTRTRTTRATSSSGKTTSPRTKKTPARSSCAA